MKKKLPLILIAALVVIAIVVVVALTGNNSNEEDIDISKATNLDGIKGATIAAQGGTFHLTALEELGTVNVREYPDFAQLLIALKAGVIHGYVAEEPTALAVVADDSSLGYIPLVNNQTGFTATDADTGIAVAFKTGSEYVAKVNPIIAKISTETRSNLMKQIVTMSTDTDKALGEDLALTSTNTDTSNGTLRIAMECNYQPFNWAQTTDVNGAVPIKGSALFANGYDVQVAKYIAAELGMALEVHMVEWGSLIPGLQAGTYDGIIAGMSPTADREAVVDFTDCYYNSNLVIIYKKAN